MKAPGRFLNRLAVFLVGFAAVVHVLHELAEEKTRVWIERMSKDFGTAVDRLNPYGFFDSLNRYTQQEELAYANALRTNVELAAKINSKRQEVDKLKKEVEELEKTMPKTDFLGGLGGIKPLGLEELKMPRLVAPEDLIALAPKQWLIDKKQQLAHAEVQLWMLEDDRAKNPPEKKNWFVIRYEAFRYALEEAGIGSLIVCLATLALAGWIAYETKGNLLVVMFFAVLIAGVVLLLLKGLAMFAIHVIPSVLELTSVPLLAGVLAWVADRFKKWVEKREKAKQSGVTGEQPSA